MATPEQDAQSLALLQKGNQLGAQASAQTGLAYPSTIGSAQLAPAQSFTIPPTPQQTESAGLGSYFENLSSATSSAKEGRDDSFASLMQSLTQTQGETALTDQAYSQKGGVDNLKVELDDINAQLFGEQEGLRRTTEEIQNNAEGLTRGGVAGKIDEARRKSLRTQADLAVVQLSRQGRYNSAKEVADRAVSAILEKQKQQNELRRFIYDEHKDLFTKAEAREFEANQKERDRTLANEEYRLRAEFDQKIKQQDPLYQLTIAKMQKEIRLMGEPTAAERKQMEADIKEANASIPVMRDKIDAVDLLKKHAGFNSRVGTTPFDRKLFGGKDKFSGAGQDFAGGIHKLVGGMTLQNLIDAKNRGATFGALSEGELRILASSATAINDWEVKDDKGNPTGAWNIDEASFERELDTIKTLTQRAIQQSGQSLISDDEDALIDQMSKENTPFNPASYY